MEAKNIKEFYKFFNEIVDNLVISDLDIKQSIGRKVQHTFRVCENVRSIGTSLQLSDNELRIGETIALFHGIGRFEQYIKHRTLVDSVKDHGELGILLLENYEVLNFLSKEEKNIILRSIRYHNKYQLPKDEDERVLLFSKLIRDADKMDNYFIHVKYFEEKSDYHNEILKVLPDTGEYSPEVVQAILSNKCPEDDHIKTYNDLKLAYVAWLFDINFNYAIEYIVNNDYIPRLITSLPENEDMDKIFFHINDFIWNKLKLKS
ncbi:HD domain-containing protein [Clostridium sp. Marseille-Q7071]